MSNANKPINGATESVYQAHRDRVFDRTSSTDGHIVTECKYPQGHYIDQMKEYADFVIQNEDATTMSCATFTDFELVCDHVGNETEIRIDRVYPALRHIGYNIRYHIMKVNGGDVFTEINKLVGRYKASMNRDVLLMVSSGSDVFHDVRTKKFRVSKQTSTIAINDAGDAGIKTSNLNLYLALTGLKTIVENESYYILHRDDELIVDVLRILNRANKSLLYKKEFLESGLKI